jgi:hypothetical protein
MHAFISSWPCIKHFLSWSYCYLTKTFLLCVYDDKGIFLQIFEIDLNQFGGYLQKFQINYKKRKRKGFKK